MREKFSYTATARRLWKMFPVLTYLSIQINFWIIANLLLGIIMHIQALRINEIAHLPGISRLNSIVWIAIIFGFLYGLILGMAGYYLEKKFYGRKSLGTTLLLNIILSLVVLALLLAFVRYLLVDLLLADYTDNYPLTHRSWEYYFLILLIYYFFMSLLINFINQVNKKYGPGVLVPLLLGKYRNPREEERIFMFMDLKSSTPIAEKLGHLQYSAFIRDSFSDINNVVSAYDAEIYQYVGDEIVLSWEMADGIRNGSCIHFFFACQEEFLKRVSYYQKSYGQSPVFKAGIHGGKVTAVEIGNIKRDIAYHGDVLNTAARIQGLCNQYNVQLLISSEILKKINLNDSFLAKTLGQTSLRGKEDAIEITAISKINSM